MADDGTLIVDPLFDPDLRAATGFRFEQLHRLVNRRVPRRAERRILRATAVHDGARYTSGMAGERDVARLFKRLKKRALPDG